MNLRDKNVFPLCKCIVVAFCALLYGDLILVRCQHPDESLPLNSGDLIMREDAEEIFYNVDIDKYQALGIKCPEPQAPDNGIIVGKSTRVGSVVYIQCKEGYRLEGPTVMACVPTSNSAQWDPKVRRICVEGSSNFDEEHSKSDANSVEISAHGKLLEPSDNRPMGFSNPGFIGPRVHAVWTRHHGREHENDEEENTEQVEEEYEQVPEHCLLSPETGPCRASFKRFYFNKATLECQPFIYGGCHGNQNNFGSLEECNMACLRHEE